MKDLIPTTVLYALIFGIVANLLFPQFLIGNEVYLGSDAVTYSIFLSAGIVIFALLIRQRKVRRNSPNQVPHLLVQVLLFSFVAALCFGIGHVIMVTFFDPNWAQKTLVLLQKQWDASNYSPEDIAGQIEWTDTFHNPWKWGMVYAIYFTIVFSLIGLVITLLLTILQAAKSNYRINQSPNKLAKQ